MLLTKEEEKTMLEYAKRHKRSKNQEWLARHFSNILQGWIGLSDEAIESMDKRARKMGKEKEIKTESGNRIEQKGKSKPWRCLKCGKCCEFIIIPVERELDLETEMYLMAHGIAHDGKKLIIPAVCKYLGSDNQCRIHTHKFANCRLGGRKECEEAKKAWYLLNSG